MDTKFEVLTELFIEFLEILSVLADFLEKFKAFLSDILLDNLQNLIVLEIFSADVKRQIL